MRPLTKEYAYDADRNLTGLKIQCGGSLLADNRYTYDGNGNRLEKQQLSGTTRYAYDALNQLVKAEYPTFGEELFYYRAGNRTRRRSAGVEEMYAYDADNHLTKLTRNGADISFYYDRAGNLVKDDKATYAYDAFNRNTRVETFDGNIQINRYDAEGLRSEMEENGRLAVFIFNPAKEVVTETEDRTVLRYILNKGNEDNKVYFGIKDDIAQYTGITNQILAARLRQHNAKNNPKRKGFQRLDEQFSNLTRNQARAIEQYFIENAPNALNEINSIGNSHRYYKDAMNWAKQYLKERGVDVNDGYK